MRRCCVPGCNSNHVKPYVPTFLFPKDEHRRKMWERNIGQHDIKISDNVGVCIKHFLDDYIIRPHADDDKAVRKTVKLKKEAVPSIFPEKTLTSPTEVKKKRKLSKDVSSEESSPIKSPVKVYISEVRKEKVEEVDESMEDASESITPFSSPNQNSGVNVETSSYNAKLLRKRSLSVDTDISSESYEVSKDISAAPSAPKRRKQEKPPPSVVGKQNDVFCWVCHKDPANLPCCACPRSYHPKCARVDAKESTVDWICPECSKLIYAETAETRSSALSNVSLSKFSELLKICFQKIKGLAYKQFHMPVPVDKYIQYLDYVICPMDLSLIEKKIRQKFYGSTHAFLADVKWIHHNSTVFNGAPHNLSINARKLVKTVERDMIDIETCPDCYYSAEVDRTTNKFWFSNVCENPHPVIYCKMKGFPYWPAKIVRINYKLDQVDARFFGAHDRAWVAISQCFHLSEKTPNSGKPKKKQGYDAAFEELEVHIKLLREKFGRFNFAPMRVQFSPKNAKYLSYSKTVASRKIAASDDKIATENSSVENSSSVIPSETGEQNNSLVTADSSVNDDDDSYRPTTDDEIEEKISDDICILKAPAPKEKELIVIDDDDDNDDGQKNNEGNKTMENIGNDNEIEEGEVVEENEKEVEKMSNDKPSEIDSPITESLEIGSTDVEVLSEKPCESEVQELTPSEVHTNEKLTLDHDFPLFCTPNEMKDTSPEGEPLNSNIESLKILESALEKIKDYISDSKASDSEEVCNNEKLKEVDGLTENQFSSPEKHHYNSSTEKESSESPIERRKAFENFSGESEAINISCEKNDDLQVLPEKDNLQILEKENNSQISCTKDNLQISLEKNDNLGVLEKNVENLFEDHNDNSKKSQNDINKDEIVSEQPKSPDADEFFFGKDVPLEFQEESVKDVQLSSTQKLDSFTLKLSETIQSMKAKLGITECEGEQVSSASESCDDEDDDDEEEEENSDNEDTSSEDESSESCTDNEDEKDDTDVEMVEEKCTNEPSVDKDNDSKVIARDTSKEEKNNDAVIKELGTNESLNEKKHTKISETPAKDLQLQSDVINVERKDANAEGDVNCNDSITNQNSSLLKGKHECDVTEIVNVEDSSSETENKNSISEHIKTESKSLKSNLEPKEVEIIDLSSSDDESMDIEIDHSVQQKNGNATSVLDKPLEQQKLVGANNIISEGKQDSNSTTSNDSLKHAKNRKTSLESVDLINNFKNKLDKTKKSHISPVLDQSKEGPKDMMQQNAQEKESNDITEVTCKSKFPDDLQADPLPPDILFEQPDEICDKVSTNKNVEMVDSETVENLKQPNVSSVKQNDSVVELMETEKEGMEEAVDIESQNEQHSNVETPVAANDATRDLEKEIQQLEMELHLAKQKYRTQELRHEQEIKELKHNMNLIIVEMRSCLDMFKKDSLESLKQKLEAEKLAAILETKEKQWCSFCKAEAIFYCCWNTGYCSQACQKQHWPTHVHHCAQINSENTPVTSAVNTPTVTEYVKLLNKSGDGSKKVFLVNMSSPNSNTSTMPQPSGVTTAVIRPPPRIISPTLRFVGSKQLKRPVPSTSTAVSNPSAPFKFLPKTPLQILFTPPQPKLTQDTSDIITKVRSRQTDLNTAITLINKMNKETIESLDKTKQKTLDEDLSKIPVAKDAGSDEVSIPSSSTTSTDLPPKNLLLAYKNDNNEEMVQLNYGVEISRKKLEVCVEKNAGSPTKLARSLMEVLFPDPKVLAESSVFGRKSNVSKLTRPALKVEIVEAILDFVTYMYPTAPKTEIVLAMNLKCKEARLAVEKAAESTEKVLKKKLEMISPNAKFIKVTLPSQLTSSRPMSSSSLQYVVSTLSNRSANPLEMSKQRGNLNKGFTRINTPNAVGPPQILHVGSTGADVLNVPSKSSLLKVNIAKIKEVDGNLESVQVSSSGTNVVNLQSKPAVIKVSTTKSQNVLDNFPKIVSKGSPNKTKVVTIKPVIASLEDKQPTSLLEQMLPLSLLDIGEKVPPTESPEDSLTIDQDLSNTSVD